MKRTLVFFLSCAAAFAGCGDDEPATPPDAQPIADAPAAEDGALADAPPADMTVFALGSDYQTTGIASTLSVPSLEVTQDAIAGVASTDPVARRLGDTIYIVNRFGADNITAIDARSLTLTGQVSTGAGSNPQDVAAVDGTLYVAALAAPGVLVTSLDATEAPEVIDLSSLDPDDGLPNCTSIYYVESTVAGMSRRMLFVACGILDDTSEFLTPRGPGKVAVIDQQTHQLLDTLELTHQNPSGLFREGPNDRLYIATIPNYADLGAGCVEAIHAVGVPTYLGCAIENADLGGYASGLAAAPDGTIYVAVTEGFDPDDFGALGSLVAVDPQGAIERLSPDGERIFNVTLCPSGHLAVADAAGGLRVYDRAGSELSTEVIDIGLPPVPNGLTCY